MYNQAISIHAQTVKLRQVFRQKDQHAYMF